MTPAILSIAAGTVQKPLLKAAHDLGLAVIAVDRSPLQACRPYLTHAIVQSSHDPDLLIEALVPLRKIYDFQGVVARTSGPPVVTAARAADFLGVDGIPHALAEASLDKTVLRQQAMALGLATPGGQCLTTGGLPDGAGPWIVKPAVPKYGKKNVYRVTDESSFLAAFRAARSESLNDQVECQTVVPGADVTAMALLVQGRLHTFALMDEYVGFPDGQAKGLGVGAPSVFSGTALEADIRNRVERLIAHWGVRAGFVFFSFRLGGDGVPSLYEVNPGLCGDAIADKILPHAYPGFDPFKTDVLAMLNRDVPPIGPLSHPCVVLGGERYPTNGADENLTRLKSFPDGKPVADILDGLGGAP